jgi:hypothetical protein
MRRKVPVSLWIIVAAGVAGAFLLFQAYFKRCQRLQARPCNTILYDGCCPETNLVCFNHKCIKLFPAEKRYEP